MTPAELDDCVEWLEAKYNWHGEIEDKNCAYAIAAMRDENRTFQEIIGSDLRSYQQVIAERDRLRADLAAKEQALRKAEITLRQRQHPANEPRDPPNVLVTLGFWPDCGCGECYAIHCLGEAMAAAAALRALARKLAIWHDSEYVTERCSTCRACDTKWPYGGPEDHAAGCLCAIDGEGR